MSKVVVGRENHRYVVEVENDFVQKLWTMVERSVVKGMDGWGGTAKRSWGMVRGPTPSRPACREVVKGRRIDACLVGARPR